MTIAAITREVRLHDLLADGVIDAMAGAGNGHCARVDYLTAEEAESVCRSLRGRVDAFASYVLGAPDDPQEAAGDLYCPADTAIERRNRKQDRVCLFVPVGTVDATISSLGNSFAAVDGRDLYKRAEQRLMSALHPGTRAMLDAIKHQLRGLARVSKAAILDLALAAELHEHAGTLGSLGRELWQVGLIVDARPDFETYLAMNRTCAGLLARPSRLSASYRDRIASLGVDDKTAELLEAFFARRPLDDIRAWSHALAAVDGLTFDRWVFPDRVESDLTAVRIRPFTESGDLVKGSKFLPLIERGDPLRAACGDRQTLIIRWDTDPPKARGVQGWRIALVPGADADVDDDDDVFMFPSRLVKKGDAKTVTLRLNIEKGDLPPYAVCAVVTALDATGAELQGPGNQPIEDRSEEFFLVEEGDDDPPLRSVSRETVPTLGLGRLQISLKTKADTVSLGSPKWTESSGTAVFSMRAEDASKSLVNVSTSLFLLAVQRRTLHEPDTGGRYALTCEEVVPASVESVFANLIPLPREGAWLDFWRARSAVFARIRDSSPDGAIEAIDWVRGLTSSVVKYAQVYAALLDELTARAPQAGIDALQAALSVDTLTITMRSSTDEPAIIILPTHPVRLAWFAGHGTLLRKWEEDILSRPSQKRRGICELGLLSDLRPVNMPAFAYGSLASAEPFVFFQNLHFFYGVALPAHARDPHRRYLELAAVVGARSEIGALGDQRPERLTEHLRDFRTIHPYADPLAVTLINPDNGEFFARAIDQLEQLLPEGQDDLETEPDAPTFTITAYVMDEATTELTGLQRLRQLAEQTTRRPTDYLQPSLATTIRRFDDIKREDLADAHIAILSDLTKPQVRERIDTAEETGSDSLSLYGLIVRFVSSLHSSDLGIVWRHRIGIPTPSKADEHPAEPRLSAALISAQRASLRASGQLLAPKASEPIAPCLEVAIDVETADLLEQVHEHADWVVTIDRFFGIDYYDSPQHEILSAMAQKHLIDYTPEFVDGLGHRSIVTTAWRDEVGAILLRAMTELGFAAVENSVRQLLYYLKTVSGRLALDALGRDSSGAAAVSLAAVTAWLQQKGRLAQGFLVPVDAHRSLFWPSTSGVIQEGDRRCDLALFTLRRNIVEVSFIEVKWRRGPVHDVSDLGQDMAVQMRASATVMQQRFFNPDRVDGALQRSYLANVLRFYCERARRYGLLAPETVEQYHGHLRQLEREGLSFRARLEGFIVSLESQPRKSLELDDDTSLTVLTATDFETAVTNLPVALTNSSIASAPNRSADASTALNARRSAEGENAPINQFVPEGNPTDGTEHGEENHNVTTEPWQRAAAADAATAIRIVLGTTGARDTTWQPAVQGSPHLFITGIPGQGKSWTTMRLLIELRHQGVPALVFDFHGQMGAMESPYFRAVRPQVIDAAKGLPFSPFECSGDGTNTGWEATAAAISDIFGYVCGLGDIQHDALFTTIRDAYRARGYGAELAHDELPKYPTLQDVLGRLERAEGQRQTQNVVARCRPLLEMNLFRPPPDGSSNLIGSIRDGLVIDLHSLISETLQNAAGAFILRKLYTDMFSWGMADRIRLALVLDEAHRLARDVTLPKIMKEGRKFGILVVVASQGLRDFHPDVLGNAGTKIAFRANFPEARKIASFFQSLHGQELAGILANLRVGTALVQTPEMRTALQVHMSPLQRAPDR